MYPVSDKDQSTDPSLLSFQRQLESQMEAERNRRKQLLDTEAQINIAEGHKRRVILESEGHVNILFQTISHKVLNRFISSTYIAAGQVKRS